MKGKNWLITHNNPKNGLFIQDYVAGWEGHCNYINGQLEKGVLGTPHFQVYISLKKEFRLAGLRKVDPLANFTLVTRDNGASAYCMKDEGRLDGPIEFGIRPLDPSSKTDWEAAWQAAKTGNIEAIPPRIKVQNYNNLKRI